MDKKDKFMELLDPVYPNLERYAYSISGSKQEAKDIVGDTVLAAYENFGSLKSDDAFLSFIFTIAKRVKVAGFRKTFRHQPTSPEKFDLLYGSASSPEEMTDIRILYEALDKMKFKYREAVELYEIFGLSYKEIAAVQETSINNVKQRIKRGREKLGKLLGVDNKKPIKNPVKLIKPETKLNPVTIESGAKNEK